MAVIRLPGAKYNLEPVPTIRLGSSQLLRMQFLRSFLDNLFSDARHLFWAEGVLANARPDDIGPTSIVGNQIADSLMLLHVLRKARLWGRIGAADKFGLAERVPVLKHGAKRLHRTSWRS